MEPTEIARKLIDDLITALESAKPQEPGAQEFTNRLVVEMRSAVLVRNPSLPDGISPTKELRSIFEDSDEWHSNSLLHAIYELWPHFSWIRADQFYPEPEHRHFSEKVWGALLVGEDDALFSADSRYISLLIVIAPNTTYPLHAHRIEESYYVLSGNADWSHDGTVWTTLPPGSIFFNRSNQPHAIRSSGLPLIAMGLYLPPFGWEGGLLA